jgi:hypothetical protein
MALTTATADSLLDEVVKEVTAAQEHLRPIYEALRAALRTSQPTETRKKMHERLTVVERRLRCLAQVKAATRALLADGYPIPLPLRSTL